MDVDIDFPPDFDPLDYFDEAVRASMVTDGALKKHPAGAYFQNIPKDGLTSLAAIPHKEAEELGYFKIDFLHLNVLSYFDNKDEIRALLRIDPDWKLLLDEDNVAKLFQINKHFKIVKRIKPQSIIELADCIALIRPGKRHLLQPYLKDKDVVRRELYRRPDDGGYYYKKGHAVSYAMVIVLQLHLIAGQIL